VPKHRRSGPSTSRRLASATVVGAAVTGAVFGASGAATAADSPTVQNFNVQNFKPSTGSAKPMQQVAFKGRFADRGVPMVGQTVNLQASAPGKPWHTVRHTTTDVNGVARTAAPVHASGEWRMVMTGDLADKRVTPTKTVHVVQPKAKVVLSTAAKLAGTPYEYGGTSPSGFDCSGFTKYVFSKVGVDLPRTSSAQSDAVKTVAKAAKKPGDLLFFSDGGDVYHTAIYAGHGKMWTAPESGETVKLDNIFSSSYTVGRAW
jgi:cell wall-associated NlpC family hydrolase